MKVVPFDRATIAKYRAIRARYSEAHSAFASVGGYLADLAAETRELRALFGCRDWWKLPAFARLAAAERARTRDGRARVIADKATLDFERSRLASVVLGVAS